MTTTEFNNNLLELRDSLEYFAYSLTSNREDAKDLVQDTLVKALVYRDKFVDDTNLKAWTYTIMKNTFINNYRRSQKSNTIIDNTEDLYFLNVSKKADYPSPESQMFTKELQNGISRLEEDHRVPFEMHFAGYKYKEIAEKLDLSIGTVKSRIFFSRKKLMDGLKEFKN